LTYPKTTSQPNKNVSQNANTGVPTDKHVVMIVVSWVYLKIINHASKRNNLVNLVIIAAKTRRIANMLVVKLFVKKKTTGRTRRERRIRKRRERVRRIRKRRTTR